MSNAAPAIIEQRTESVSHVLSDIVRQVPVQPERRIRRRATREQGQALERLGHAIEYLVDSRLFMTGKLDVRAEQEAVQLLMRMSRSVFAECHEVVPVWEQVSRLCRRSFSRQ
jgi:hypothetical protein